MSEVAGPRSLHELLNAVLTIGSDLDLPANVTAQVGGENEDIDESFRNLFLSIIVALVLVFLLLAGFSGARNRTTS